MAQKIALDFLSIEPFGKRQIIVSGLIRRSSGKEFRAVFPCNEAM